MHTHKLSVACLVLFAAQMVAHADTVFLTDGSKREGTVTDEDSSSVKLRVKHGPLTATVEIPRKEIARIEFKAVAVNDDEIQFQLLGKEAERIAKVDPKNAKDAWLRYAHFCTEKTGYSGYAKSAYEKVLEIEPNHAEARQALGYVFGELGWSKPKEEQDFTITVGPRYVYTPSPPSYVTYTPPETTTQYSSPTTASSRDSYYGNEYGNEGSSRSVIFLGSVNGRLAPVSQSQFFYGNWNRTTPSGNSTTSTQYGRTGYYSDGYYSSGGTGTMHYSGSTVNSTTTITSGGYTAGSGSYYQSGINYWNRR